ncbi:MAG: hypothetical protein ABJL86_01660 [Gilvibacter sp.]
MSEKDRKLELRIAGLVALGCVDPIRYMKKTGEVIEVESTCIDCGWHGAESEHHFLDGWHVCPKCHQAEFLVSGDELDEMNESEGVPF